MSTTTAPIPVVGDRYWMVLIARAVPAGIVALAITFSADHSVGVGWLSLAVFGVLTGAVVAVGSYWMLRGQPRALLTAQGIVLALVGLTAIVGRLALPLPALVIALAVGFGLSGAIELTAGIRARGVASAARDWIFLGAASIAVAVAVLLVPTDLSQPITVPGKVVPDLTASVMVVGALGAYAAIVAVFPVIAGLSLKWAQHPDAVSPLESAS